VSAPLDRCPRCGGPATGAGIPCLGCSGPPTAAGGYGYLMARGRGRPDGPPLQPFVGWFLMVLGAIGLSYGLWRLLNAAAQRSASPAQMGGGDSAGVLWALVLFFLLPGAMVAGAGIALLRRRSPEA